MRVRTRFLTLFAATAVAATALAAAGAHAGTVTETYTYGLSNFVDGFGNAPPPDTSISGSFTVTFDPNAGASNDTVDIVTHSLNGVTIDSPLSFSFGGDGAGGFFLSMGGLDNGAGEIATFDNDFTLQLLFADGSHLNAPTLALCTSPGYFCGSETNAPGATASGYTVANQGEAWFATSGSVRGDGPAGVPEPASWALMLLGFGGLGAILRGRRRIAPILA